MTHPCQHRQNGLHDHSNVPRSSCTRFLIRRISLRAVEGAICQDHHLVFKVGNQVTKGSIRCIRRRIIPRHDQAILIDQGRQLGSNDPAMVGQPLAPDLQIRPVFAPRMEQLDAGGIGDAQRRRLCQESLGPISVRGEQTKQTGALGKEGNQWR